LEPKQGESDEPVVLGLIHPDRQAAEVLRLFTESPAPHPAAALAAWKRAAPDPAQLDKPIEALISFFNPEMVREWSTLHEAQVQVGQDPKTGLIRWRLAVPRDDGTFAALITSLRLSGGAAEAPLDGSGMAVERLDKLGDFVAARSPQGIILASSRVDLDRAVQTSMSGWIDRFGAERAIGLPLPLPAMPDSGLVFRIKPGVFGAPAGGSVVTRRAIELVRGLKYRTIDGTLGLKGDRLRMELVSRIDPASPLVSAGGGKREIELDWLKWVPGADAVAVACFATGQGGAYWDEAFALADRVDRADPERAGLAPLRTRVNLMAAATGARLEADLWPHLRGMTLGLLTDPANPTRPSRACLALQMDSSTTARQLVVEVLPRLAVIWGGPRIAARPAPVPGVGPAALADPAAPQSLGRIGGRSLLAAQRGWTVLIAWGDGTLAALLHSAERPEDSVVSLLQSRSRGPDHKAVDRMGAFWPGRIRLRVKGLGDSTPLERSLAEGSPIVWIGWNLGELACDSVSWDELRPQVHRFLSRIPLAPATGR
jgi:hypothetical protein